MQFLYKSDKFSLFGQMCQHEVSCKPGFVEQRTCITNGGGVCGGAAPPQLKSMDKDQNTRKVYIKRKYCLTVSQLEVSNL